MKRIVKVLIALFAIQNYAYGAIPPPPAAEPKPDTAVSDDPAAQPPPAGETETQPGDVAIDPPANRPTTDTTSTNKPPKDWYKDMYKQLYDMQQYASYVQKAYYSPQVSYYASYLYYVLDKVYSYSYVSYDQPKTYSWGYPTRGDFNHSYYYYIRPLYKKVLYYGSQYYKGLDPYYYPAYSHNFTPFYKGYHTLTRCMFGKDGNDMQAEDDTALAQMENQAGLK